MKGFWLVSCLMLAGLAPADEQSARSCTSVADKMARLACYDAAFGVNTAPVAHPATAGAAATPPAPASASQTAPASPVPAVVKTPESAFGDTGNLIGTDKPVIPKRLTLTVLNAVPSDHGLYRLTMDNGQVWQTTQADWAVDFDAHDSVTISRMLAGNYLISHAGQGRTVAVKRIQ